MPMVRVLPVILAVICQTSAGAGEMLTAPNKKASPINQRRAYGNACGPASLLNAFQYGSSKWQNIFYAIPGTNSKTRIRYVVSKWGERPSLHIKGIKRWDPKQGINLLDLTDMANEMRDSHFTPRIKNEILTRKSRQKQIELLHHSHKLITKSLKKGLPPILSIRRYAYRDSDEVGAKSWWPIRAHFIVVIETPKKISRSATSYHIKYVDPFGGYTRNGVIHTDTGDFSNSPFLAATMPGASIGRALLRDGEETVLTFPSIIGCW